MRRALEVALLISTTVILIATSRVPVVCATETVVLHAQTTCGEETNLEFVSESSCALTVRGDGGLPSEGNIADYRSQAGVTDGFDLVGPRIDGGPQYRCTAVPADGGGLFVTCDPESLCADAGLDGGGCEQSCSGSLTVP